MAQQSTVSQQPRRANQPSRRQSVLVNGERRHIYIVARCMANYVLVVVVVFALAMYNDANYKILIKESVLE